MECNKDEAIRAKELAEKKLKEKDIAGAKRFASKAQSLFPGLEGLPQFLEILNVHVTSEKRVNGEIDCYEILGVDPLADDETIRKNYRKLSLAFHPDKNKSVGADGAFKILSEAWSLLSDKTRKAAYNDKCNTSASHQQVRDGNPSVGAGKSRYKNLTSSLSNTKNAAVSDNPPTGSTPCNGNPNTFWTSCNICFLQFEFMAIYRNQYLLCPNCRKPFLATEAPPPVKGHIPSTQCPFFQQKQGANHTANNISPHLWKLTPNLETFRFSGTGTMGRANVSQGSSSKTNGERSVAKSTMATDQPAQSLQSMGMNLKRGYEEALSGATKESHWKRSNASKKIDTGVASENGSNFGKREKEAKRRRVNEHKPNVGAKGMANQMPPGAGHSVGVETSGSQMGGLGSEKVVSSGSNKHKILREFPQSEACHILMEKAKMEIRKKINEFRLAATSRSSGKEGNNMGKKTSNIVNATQESNINGIKEENMNAFEDTGTQPISCSLSSLTIAKTTENISMGVPLTAELSEASLSDATTDSDMKAASGILSMSLPDPDFHDFDMDRCEKSFSANQVWAIYDIEDAMPRLYALISRVITEQTFKIMITWLTVESKGELGLLNLGHSFPNSIGYFRTVKRKFDLELNSFSHKVNWMKDARGIYQIFPRKGDVWALYRNWSPDWNGFTLDYVVRKYDVVEVLENYNEEKGVPVAPLVKVAGFMSVFHQHLDPREIYIIPRKEMSRFSHQIPKYILTGKEGEKAPKGCWELDPAALPLELLQVMTDVEEGMSKEIQRVERLEEKPKLKGAQEQL